MVLTTGAYGFLWLGVQISGFLQRGPEAEPRLGSDAKGLQAQFKLLIYNEARRKAVFLHIYVGTFMRSYFLCVWRILKENGAIWRHESVFLHAVYVPKDTKVTSTGHSRNHRPTSPHFSSDLRESDSSPLARPRGVRTPGHPSASHALGWLSIYCLSLQVWCELNYRCRHTKATRLWARSVSSGPVRCVNCLQTPIISESTVRAPTCLIHLIFTVSDYLFLNHYIFYF